MRGTAPLVVKSLNVQAIAAFPVVGVNQILSKAIPEVQQPQGIAEVILTPQAIDSVSEDAH